MKDKNKKISNLDFGREFNCGNCQNNNVEFSCDFDENKKHKKNSPENISSRTNAYAGGTEFSNELGTTRSDFVNNPLNEGENLKKRQRNLNDNQNFQGLNTPYFLNDDEILTEFSEEPNRNFDNLEEARKRYFEQLRHKHGVNNQNRNER